jgi:hypothetical protein
MVGDLEHGLEVLLPRGAVMDERALGAEAGGFDGGRVFIERDRVHAGDPLPVLAEWRVRLRSPNDIGDYDVAAGPRDASEFTEAFLETDDRRCADAIGGIGYVVSQWQATAIGAEVK